MEFDFGIVRRAGVRHQAADALSRILARGTDESDIKDEIRITAVATCAQIKQKSSKQQTRTNSYCDKQTTATNYTLGHECKTHRRILRQDSNLLGNIRMIFKIRQGGTFSETYADKRRRAEGRAEINTSHHVTFGPLLKTRRLPMRAPNV